MTVVLTAITPRYIGVSGDSKPTSRPAGSTFYETDTGATYVYDGTAWQLRLGPAGPFRASKTITFDGTAALGQAATAVPVFTLTGEVLIEYMIAFCTTSLTEAGATAQISLGVVGNVGLFVSAGQPIDIDQNEFWTAADPTAVGGVAVPAAMLDILIANGANIIADPTTDDTSGGVIEFTALWRPVSSDGLVVAA